MDFSTIGAVSAANQGAELEVLHPSTNLPTGAKITLAGSDSDIYRKIIREQQNARLKRTMKHRGKPVPLTAEELEAEGLDLLVGCTLKWDNVEEAGAQLPCTPDNIRAIYTKFIFVREQVDEFIGDRANFLPG